MPKCGKFGAASTAGWGAGAAIFSPVEKFYYTDAHCPMPNNFTVLFSTKNKLENGFTKGKKR